MGKNGYLEKRKILIDGMTRELPRDEDQLLLDAAILALNRLGWGYTRIKRFEKLLSEQHDRIVDAILDEKEGDVKQERIDNEMRAIVAGHQEFYNFRQSYPNVKYRDYLHVIKGVEATGWHGQT